MENAWTAAGPVEHGNRITVRRIGVADLKASLSEGVADFLACPTQLVFLCILYPIIGFVAARVAADSDLLPLFYPLVTGLALVGPVLAVGLYEISKRREQGLPVSWLNAFDILRSPSFFSVVAIGVMLFVIFFVWLAVARAIFELVLGSAAPSISMQDFAQQVIASPSFWTLALVGNAVGGLFAILVLTLTAVSVPMLVDRNVGPFVAVGTSVRVVLANPVTMALWGLIVAVILALGCLPLFIGLAVAMPVLGHATWHLYRKAVER